MLEVGVFLLIADKTPVTGIELNTLAYSEAVKNVELYLYKHEMINEGTFVDVYLEVTW